MDAATRIFEGKTRIPDTRWSVLLAQPADARWEELIRAYWRPVYRQIRRRWGKSNEDAKDLTQQFLVSLIEDDALSRVSPEHGRLRHFIKACLDNFMRNARRSDAALKRGGGAQRIALDFIEAHAVADSAELPFDADWRRALLEDALAALEREYAEAGKPHYVEIFRNCYLERGESYRELAARLGISEDDVDNALRHAKARFKALVVSGVRDTVATSEDLHDEIETLFGPAR